jgi:hypothetical protein
LENCGPDEVYQLILTRFADRKAKEEAAFRTGFISDGSALHEWAYGMSRMIHGANGPGSEIKDPGYTFAITAFGEIAKRHAKQTYQHVIHLPPEFPLPKDGHRPVSESFRNHADELIKQTWDELEIGYHTVTGTIEERLAQIVDVLGLEVSTTLGGPRRNHTILHYDKIEDALGPQAGRYFSDGFRLSQNYIYDIDIDPLSREISAKVNFVYPSNWSTKAGENCRCHVASNDALLVFGQLAQLLMYSEDGITREQSGNMWLRRVDLKPVKSIEEFYGVPVVLREVETSMPTIKGKEMHCATMKGHLGKNKEFRLNQYSVAYEMPQLALLTEKVLVQ